jgi:RHS repeat-associated protein
LYFYHPDHLGTSTFLTDINGNAYQFFLNLPFGETMAEQLGGGYYNTPYKFNGKELDAETGLYYYGARYYDPRVSIWYSVDPLAEKNPDESPYMYCTQNPVRFVDPDGREGIDIIDFIPFVGSARDIYRGVRDGDMTTLAFGVGGLILDIATAGSAGSLIKSGIKAASKQIAETSLKATLKQIPKVLAETAVKKSGNLRKALGLVVRDGMEAHHLIPKELLKKSDVVKDAVVAGFDFNGAVNGFAVKAGHGPHAKYTESIMEAIKDFKNAKPNYTLKEAKKFMEKLASQAKEAIIKNGGDVKTTKL